MTFLFFIFFFFNDTATTEIYTLFPTRRSSDLAKFLNGAAITGVRRALGASRRQIFLQHLVERSEEHTSELQSRLHLVCRLLLEKKKKKKNSKNTRAPCREQVKEWYRQSTHSVT